MLLLQTLLAVFDANPLWGWICPLYGSYWRFEELWCVFSFSSIRASPQFFVDELSIAIKGFWFWVSVMSEDVFSGKLVLISHCKTSLLINSIICSLVPLFSDRLLMTEFLKIFNYCFSNYILPLHLMLLTDYVRYHWFISVKEVDDCEMLWWLNLLCACYGFWDVA